MRTDFLAGLFRWLRDVIEEADRPVSVLIMVALPFVAPIIPAWVTKGNLERYMDYEPQTALLAAIAFALVGYVAMISSIGAIMNYIEQEKNNRVWLPVAISVGSYAVYVLALILVNIVLEIENNVPATKVAVTALMTLGLEIPTSLLNGTRIQERNKEDRNAKLRKEKRETRMETLRIKMESSKKVSNRGGKFPESSEESLESFQKVSSWRKVRPQLSREQLESLAKLSPDQMRQYAAQTGMTYKTISNWRTNARNELGINQD